MEFTEKKLVSTEQQAGRASPRYFVQRLYCTGTFSVSRGGRNHGCPWFLVRGLMRFGKFPCTIAVTCLSGKYFQSGNVPYSQFPDIQCMKRQHALYSPVSVCTELRNLTKNHTLCQSPKRYGRVNRGVFAKRICFTFNLKTFPRYRRKHVDGVYQIVLTSVPENETLTPNLSIF